jgi:O-antigen ligase
MILQFQGTSAKADRPLATYILGSSVIFALGYILNLDSGPLYFGVASLALVILCVMSQGLRMPTHGTNLLVLMALVALPNTLFAMSREQTGVRWLMVISLYAFSLRLTELPAGSIRRTLELTLPAGLLIQIAALLWHLDANLGEEKTRLIWHTISLFAGLLLAIGLGFSNRWYAWALSIVGMGFIAFSGARGALVGLMGMTLAWVACQPPGRRLLYATFVTLVGVVALLFGGDLLNTFSGIKVTRVTDDPIEHMMKSFEGRMELIRAAIDYAKEVPIFGTGLGPAYSTNFKVMTGLGHPHNSYAGMIIEVGFILGPLYLLGSILAMKKAAQVTPTANLSLLLGPSLAYFLVRGLAENYTLLALGNFATSMMVLFVAIALNHRAR